MHILGTSQANKVITEQMCIENMDPCLAMCSTWYTQSLKMIQSIRTKGIRHPNSAPVAEKTCIETKDTGLTLCSTCYTQYFKFCKSTRTDRHTPSQQCSCSRQAYKKRTLDLHNIRCLYRLRSNLAFNALAPTLASCSFLSPLTRLVPAPDNDHAWRSCLHSYLHALSSRLWLGLCLHLTMKPSLHGARVYTAFALSHIWPLTMLVPVPWVTCPFHKWKRLLKCKYKEEIIERLMWQNDWSTKCEVKITRKKYHDTISRAQRQGDQSLRVYVVVV